MKGSRREECCEHGHRFGKIFANGKIDSKLESIVYNKVPFLSPHLAHVSGRGERAVHGLSRFILGGQALRHGQASRKALNFEREVKS